MMYIAYRTEPRSIHPWVDGVEHRELGEYLLGYLVWTPETLQTARFTPNGAQIDAFPGWRSERAWRDWLVIHREAWTTDLEKAYWVREGYFVDFGF